MFEAFKLLRLNKRAEDLVLLKSSTSVWSIPMILDTLNEKSCRRIRPIRSRRLAQAPDLHRGAMLQHRSIHTRETFARSNWTLQSVLQFAGAGAIPFKECVHFRFLRALSWRCMRWCVRSECASQHTHTDTYLTPSFQLGATNQLYRDAARPQHHITIGTNVCGVRFGLGRPERFNLCHLTKRQSDKSDPQKGENECRGGGRYMRSKRRSSRDQISHTPPV